MKVKNIQGFIDVLRSHDATAHISPTKISKFGVYFDNFNLSPRWLKPYKDGFFSIQDEGSQLIVDMVKVVEGDSVLDFCAGTGTKASQIASRMNNKGLVNVMDSGKNGNLKSARNQCSRMGVSNVKFITDDKEMKSLRKQKVKWILLHAPSTNTGNIRRNPEIKRNFSNENLEKMVKLQRQLFEEALPYLNKKEGYIIYSTNSILPIENEEQVAFFLRKHNFEVIGSPLKYLPSTNGPDGVFAVTLKMKGIPSSCQN
jgi:16S rRNA (cytosine967-C5)-methyltransferase